jgi:translocation and assembly module TamA
MAASYNFVNRFDWRQNYFVNYQHDDYQINDLNEVSDLFILGSSVNRTIADDALFPSRGWRLFAQLRGASDTLLSSESFLQFNLVGKYINTIGPGRLILKFESGVTMVDDIDELPVSIQYFSGGDQSVRGYKYQSLGPLNELGEVTGGKHLLSAGIEYDFNVRPNWKMAVFFDAGNSFNSTSQYRAKKGVGIGVRWMSPIGPIRADLASALDDDNRLRLHVTMGPDL